ncbi:MAG TPA: hypothetical protein V6C85_12720 [Allocoleopsis sp.]
MVETQRPTDVAVYNERSLKALDRALALSQGEFSLVLVHCNYKRLRDRVVRQLRELCANRYEIRELELPSSVTTLYTTIQTYRHSTEDVGTRERGDAEKAEDIGIENNEETKISSTHISPSPHLPVSPSPRLPVSPSPHLPISSPCPSHFRIGICRRAGRLVSLHESSPGRVSQTPALPHSRVGE